MRGANPIPRRSLPHSAVLLPAGGGEIELRHVRADGGLRLDWAVRGQTPYCDKVLYYDCVNSLPGDVCFEAGDRVRLALADGDRVYTVSGVDAVAGDMYGKAVHHWEVALA